MKHTPGPWKYLGVTDIGWEVALPRHDGRTWPVDSRSIRCEGWSEAEAIANGTLVAASPDLLAAAKRILLYCEPVKKYASQVEAFEDLRAAVAKAERVPPEETEA